MATRDEDGSPPYDEWPDTESESSYAGSALASAVDPPACPYRDTQHNDQECSRFFDCPTHVVERPSIDGNVDHRGNLEGGLGAAPGQDTNSTSSQPMERFDTEHQGRAIELDEEEDSSPAAEARVKLAVDEEGEHSTGAEASSSRGAVEIPSRVPEETRALANQDATFGEIGEITPNLAGITLMEALSDFSVGAGPSQETPVSQANSGGSTRGSSRPSSSALPPQAAQPVARRQPEIVLPRWQPDAEVTHCPICRHQFSSWSRKHHCRRCGKVVCASCSPHRITIPHQYIVRRPGDVLNNLRASGLWAEESGIADFSSVGGGERVRLCNPCVPDPNITPPQAQHSPNRAQFSPRSGHYRSRSSTSGTGYFGPEVSSTAQSYHSSMWIDSQSRSRSATVNSGLLPPGYSGSRYPDPSQYRGSQTSIPSVFPNAYPSSSRRPAAQPHYRSMLDNSRYSASSSSASAINNRPLPPRPQIPEEDECPVCHHELPPRHLPNFEALREGHITTCIAQHSTYSPPSTSATAGHSGTHGTPPPRVQRRTGMFPYIATEKDCVDSAECTICLEDFEAGVLMARLECLCRFHRSCIEAWFVNHPGRCPVHQHDSFGY